MKMFQGLGPLGKGKNPWKSIGLKSIQALINRNPEGITTPEIRTVLKPERLTFRLGWMEKHGTIKRKGKKWFPTTTLKGD